MMCRCSTMKLSRAMTAAMGVVAIVSFSVPAAAETVTIGATKDNTLIADPLGETSNGMGDGIYSGRPGTNSTGWVQRAVVRFNVDGVIPANSTIISADLTLMLVKTTSGNQTHTVHKILADWGEGPSQVGGGGGVQALPPDATWLFRYFPGTPWTNQGGDFVAAASASRIIGNTFVPYTWASNSALVNDVQGWVNDPMTNNGWMVRGNEVQFKTSKKFGSLQHPTPGSRPKLVVTYTPPVITCPPDVAPGGGGAGDDVVNVDDLLYIINHWGGGVGSGADVTANGTVNIDDLLAVINGWGACE